MKHINMKLNNSTLRSLKTLMSSNLQPSTRKGCLVRFIRLRILKKTKISCVMKTTTTFQVSVGSQIWQAILELLAWPLCPRRAGYWASIKSSCLTTRFKKNLRSKIGMSAKSKRVRSFKASRQKSSSKSLRIRTWASWISSNKIQ